MDCVVKSATSALRRNTTTRRGFHRSAPSTSHFTSRNLSHHDARRIAGIRQVIPIGCQYPHVPFDRQEHPKLLATRSRANRLASSTTTVWTPLPSMRSSRAEKPGRYFNRVCAAHGRVVEPIDDFQASQFRKSLDSHPLALLAVLVCPDVRLRCDKRETLNELPEEPYPQLLWGQKVDRVWQFVFSRYRGPQVSSSALT